MESAYGRGFDDALEPKLSEQPDPFRKEEFVYFISDGEAIKIGTSTRPDRRVRALQTSHPRRLRIVGVMRGGAALEQELHRKFRRVRLKGEWFSDCAEINDFIDQRCSIKHRQRFTSIRASDVQDILKSVKDSGISLEINAV